MKLLYEPEVMTLINYVENVESFDKNKHFIPARVATAGFRSHLHWSNASSYVSPTALVSSACR